MKKETVIALDLKGAQLREQYDACAKRILSHTDILAHILKATVRECIPYSIEEIKGFIRSPVQISSVPVRSGITGVEDSVPGEGVVNFDLRFDMEIPRKDSLGIKLFMDLEAQKKFYLKYPIVTRGIFYGARMLSSQLDTEFSDSEYDQLKKVYSIWICMNAPKKAGNVIVEYRINKNEIGGCLEDLESDYDKLSVVMIGFHDGSDAPSGSIHRLLATLFSQHLEYEVKLYILETEFQIAAYQEWEELKEMCNLSEAIEERALLRGIEQGIEQGICAMILDNLEENISGLRILEKLQKRFQLTPEQAEGYYRKYGCVQNN